MPLYEYRCTSCDYRFEKIQKVSDATETACPKCGGELVRPLSAPALQFKGAGWYINDYAPKPAAGSSGTASGSGSKPSESKTAESKPAESKPAETKPAATDSKPSSGSSTT